MVFQFDDGYACISNNEFVGNEVAHEWVNVSITSENALMILAMPMEQAVARHKSERRTNDLEATNMMHINLDDLEAFCRHTLEQIEVVRATKGFSVRASDDGSEDPMDMWEATSFHSYDEAVAHAAKIKAIWRRVAITTPTRCVWLEG